MGSTRIGSKKSKCVNIRLSICNKKSLSVFMDDYTKKRVK